MAAAQSIGSSMANVIVSGTKTGVMMTASATPVDSDGTQLVASRAHRYPSPQPATITDRMVVKGSTTMLSLPPACTTSTNKKGDQSFNLRIDCPWVYFVGLITAPRLEVRATAKARLQISKETRTTKDRVVAPSATTHPAGPEALQVVPVQAVKAVAKRREEDEVVLQREQGPVRREPVVINVRVDEEYLDDGVKKRKDREDDVPARQGVTPVWSSGVASKHTSGITPCVTRQASR